MRFRIGCCIPGSSFMPQGVGELSEAFGILKSGHDTVFRCGFDFAEAAVGLVAGLSADEFAAAKRCGLRFEVCNSFIPPSLAIFDTPPERLRGYMDGAMGRMAELGCEFVILGSGAARRIPDDLDPERGSETELEFLRLCDSLAAKNSLTVALEPLNSDETNFVNRVDEGFRLLSRAGFKSIRLLADSFHMYREGEPLTALRECASLLVHVHVSESDRRPPGSGGGEYLSDFARALKGTPYSGRVSAECSFTLADFPAQCARAYEKMKEIF